MFHKILGRFVVSVICAVGVIAVALTKPTQYVTISVAMPAKPIYTYNAMNPIVDPKDQYCLALNIFFEARNQKTTEAKVSVAYVVLNRVNHKHYKDSVCDVIAQSIIKNGKKRCQFSWYCDDRDNTPNIKNIVERNAWNEAKILARKVLMRSVSNPIGNAIMYHTTSVNPHWADNYTPVRTIGSHIFYES